MGIADLGIGVKTCLVTLPLVLFWAADLLEASGEMTPLGEQALETSVGIVLFMYLGFLGLTAFSHHAKIAKLEEKVNQWSGEP